ACCRSSSIDFISDPTMDALEYLGLGLLLSLFVGLIVGMIVPKRFDRTATAFFIAGILAFGLFSACVVGYVALDQGSYRCAFAWAVMYAPFHFLLSCPAALLSEFVLHLRSRKKPTKEPSDDVSTL